MQTVTKLKAAKTCQQCGVSYERKKKEAYKDYEARKYCGVVCAKLGQKKKSLTLPAKKSNAAPTQKVSETVLTGTKKSETKPKKSNGTSRPGMQALTISAKGAELSLQRKKELGTKKSTNTSSVPKTHDPEFSEYKTMANSGKTLLKDRIIKPIDKENPDQRPVLETSLEMTEDEAAKLFAHLAESGVISREDHHSPVIIQNIPDVKKDVAIIPFVRYFDKAPRYEYRKRQNAYLFSNINFQNICHPIQLDAFNEWLVDNRSMFDRACEKDMIIYTGKGIYSVFSFQIQKLDKGNYQVTFLASVSEFARFLGDD